MWREVHTMEAQEVTTFAKCRWCEKVVNAEECFADPVTRDEKTVWICTCGELISDLSAAALSPHQTE
jgi:hypothetical protein